MGEKNDPRHLCDRLSFLNFKHVILNNTQFADINMYNQMLKECKGRKKKVQERGFMDGGVTWWLGREA